MTLDPEKWAAEMNRLASERDALKAELMGVTAENTQLKAELEKVDAGLKTAKERIQTLEAEVRCWVPCSSCGCVLKLGYDCDGCELLARAEKAELARSAAVIEKETAVMREKVTADIAEKMKEGHEAFKTLAFGALKERDEARRELAEAERDAQMRIEVANRFYTVILRNIESYWPKTSRELEYDVLPGTLGWLAASEARLRTALEHARAKLLYWTGEAQAARNLSAPRPEDAALLAEVDEALAKSART